MPSYDKLRFDPPAPLAYVSLRNPTTGSMVTEVPLLLDSGADVTLVPSAAASEIGIEADHQGYELLGFDGGRSVAQAAHLELMFLNKTFRGKFILYRQDWGVLGRDVLNLLSLVLDGPQQSWSEHERG